MTKRKKAPDLTNAPVIDFRKLTDLRRNPNNARVHTPVQVSMVAASLTEFGWTMPALIDETELMIAGHGRMDAAEKLYAEGKTIRMASGIPIPPGTIPTLSAVGWTDSQKRAYLEADNRLNELGGWDQDKRARELEWLRTSGVPMAAAGWDAAVNPNDATQSEWSGMPEFEQPDARAWRSIVVHFKDQASLDKFCKVTKQIVTDKTRFLHYPEIEIKPFVKVRSTAEPAK